MDKKHDVTLPADTPPFSWPFSGIFGQQVILEWIEHGKIKQIYLVGGLEHFLFSHSVGNNNPN
jgi:hypothetical protein